METVSWLQLLILVFLAGAAVGVPWMVYFSASVMVVMGAAHWWRTRSLDRVIYRRKLHYRRGFPGETTALTVEVENRKLMPLSWLQIEDGWPVAVSPQDEAVLAPSHIQGTGTLVNVYSLRWYDRIRRSYTLLLRERGIYPLGPLRLASGDLFGIYEAERTLEQPDYLTVFPALLPLERLRLRADDPFGDRAARRPLFDDPNRPMGIRPYHPEDGFRRIHWPATARTGSLQTKIYQPVTARMVAVCLNVATEQMPWLGYAPGLLEYMVRVTATLVYQGVESGYAMGLYSNGCLAHADQPFRIPPGRTPAHLAVLLQALAGVTPYVTGSFEKFLLRTLSDIPFGATLVLVTALLPEAFQDTLIRLQRYRRQITLYKVGGELPPDLPGVQTVYLPYQESAGE
jgi:uncharacterized protein (DUF58 family)